MDHQQPCSASLRLRRVDRDSIVEEEDGCLLEAASITGLIEYLSLRDPRVRCSFGAYCGRWGLLQEGAPMSPKILKLIYIDTYIDRYLDDQLT